MRISDWSSDVCSSDLIQFFYRRPHTDQILVTFGLAIVVEEALKWMFGANNIPFALPAWGAGQVLFYGLGATVPEAIPGLRIPMPFLDGFAFFPVWRLLLIVRSEEHTSELQSLM